MTKWRMTKLGDLAEVVRGSTITRKEVTPGEVPVIAGGQTPSCFHNAFNREGTTITVSASGAYAGFVQYFEIPIFASDCSTIKVKDENEISPKFLFYMLQASQRVIYSFQRGSGQPHVYPSQLVGLDIPVPSIDEQHEIVELLEEHLSRLDAGLVDVKQAKIKAVQFRRSLLQAAFTGNLTGDGTGLMTELPNGWHLTTIGEVCEKPKYGWTTSASDIGEVKLLRTTDLTHGPITWETVPFCKEIPKTVADYLVHPNDIFISRAGSVGVSVLVKDAPYKSVFASYLIRIRPNKKIDSKYLSLFLQSPHYWNQITELSSGIALANINATKIQSINLPLPPLPEQQKIVEILEDHLSRLEASVAIADAMEKQSASLRRSLLQAAFTGQLTKEVASV